jgi:magnesium-transporting ATPase (P-type)
VTFVEKENSADMLFGMKSDEACQLSVEEIIRALETDLGNGLSLYEVDVRTKIHGPNEFEIKQEAPLWRKYLEQVKRRFLRKISVIALD